MEIGEDQDMLMEQLKALKQSFNIQWEKLEKGDETIQILQKYLKLAKEARTEGEKQTCLHSDGF